MISKSLFSNGAIVNYLRPVYDPIFTGAVSTRGGGGGGGGGFISGANDLTLITEDNLVSFKQIEQL
jgi:hypothetical protein